MCTLTNHASPSIDARVSFAQIDAPFTDGLDLRAGENQTRLDAIVDEIVVRGAPVDRDDLDVFADL